MSRTVIVLVLSLIGATCVALWGWSEASEARGQAKAAIAAQAAAEARLIHIQTNLRSVSRDYQTAREELSRIHAEAPDRPTDPRVVNVLCKRGNCAKLDPVPTPAD